MPGSSIEDLPSSSAKRRPADGLLKLALSLNDRERKRAKWRVQQRKDMSCHRNMLATFRQHRIRMKPQLELQSETAECKSRRFLPALPFGGPVSCQDEMSGWSAGTKQDTSLLSSTNQLEDNQCAGSAMVAEAWMYDQCEALDGTTIAFPVSQHRPAAVPPTNPEENSSLTPAQEQKVKVLGDALTNKTFDAATQAVIARFKRGCEEQEPLLNDLHRLQLVFKGEEPPVSNTSLFHQELKNNFSKAATRVLSHLDQDPSDGAGQPANLQSGGTHCKSKSKASTVFRTSTELSVSEDSVPPEILLQQKLQRDLELARLQECLQQEDVVLKFDCKSLLDREQEQNARFEALLSGTRTVHLKPLLEANSTPHSERSFRRRFNCQRNEVVPTRARNVLCLPALAATSAHPFVIPQPGLEQETLPYATEDDHESHASIKQPQPAAVPSCRLATSCHKEWKSTKEASRVPSEQYAAKMQVKKKAMELFGSNSRKEFSHVDAFTQWEHLKKTGLFSRMVQF
jgi:hypothetical protein